MDKNIRKSALEAVSEQIVKDVVKKQEPELRELAKRLSVELFRDKYFLKEFKSQLLMQYKILMREDSDWIPFEVINEFAVKTLHKILKLK